MSKELIIVFSKTPKIGVTKTRLAKKLGAKAALKISKTMLDDCLANLPGNYDIWINISPDCSKIEMEKIAWRKSKKIKVVCTSGKTPDEQIVSSYKEGFKAGYKKILMTTPDTLDFFSEDVFFTFKAIDKYEAVLYPAFDGGLCPHALKNPKLASAFSCNSTRKEDIIYTTTIRLKRLGKNYVFGRTVFDIDIFDDLKRYYFFFKAGVYPKNSSNKTFKLCRDLLKTKN